MTGLGKTVDQVVTEVGSRLEWEASEVAAGLSDPDARVVVVEHRYRSPRLGIEHLEAALLAQGRRIGGTDLGETTNDLVRDMIEVLTSVCVRLYGRRGAGDRAKRTVTSGGVA